MVVEPENSLIIMSRLSSLSFLVCSARLFPLKNCLRVKIYRRRELILQRQREGIQLAKASGKYKGRNSKNAQKIAIFINKVVIMTALIPLPKSINIIKFLDRPFISGYANNFQTSKISRNSLMLEFLLSSNSHSIIVSVTKIITEFFL